MFYHRHMILPMDLRENRNRKPSIFPLNIEFSHTCSLKPIHIILPEIKSHQVDYNPIKSHESSH